MTRWIAVAILLAGLTVAPAEAHAAPTGLGGTTQTGSGTRQTGGAARATSGRCSLYARPGTFGVRCLRHGTAGPGITVESVLHPDPIPTCWDELISPADYAAFDGPLGSQGGPYGLGDSLPYERTCVTGILPTDDVFDINPLLAESTIEISDPQHPLNPQPLPCPRPYTPATQGLNCVMSLTINQQQVIDYSDVADGRIPTTDLLFFPGPKVITNADSAVTDVDNDGNGITTTTNPDGTTTTRTKTYTIDGVAMWAQLDGFVVSPYGATTAPHTPCTGFITLAPDATRANTPQACWINYPQRSSAGYPLEAEADWSVWYAAGNGRPTQLGGAFAEIRDYPTPVYDIETLNLP